MEVNTGKYVNVAIGSMVLFMFLEIIHYTQGVTDLYIGVVMIEDAGTPYDIERVGPAIDIAIEKVNSEILNSSFNLRKIERRYGNICSNTRASGTYC